MLHIKEKNYPFVDNLKRIMMEKDINEQVLSDMSKIPVDDLRKILYNKEVAGPMEMVLLAKALQTDMNTLFEEREDS